MVGIYGLGKKQGLDYDADVKKALAEIERKTAEAAERRKIEEEKALKEKAAGRVPEAATQDTGTVPVR